VLAVVGSGLVYATAIVVPSSLRKAKLTSIIAVIMVSVQIILGYLTVTAGLYPFVVVTHVSTGITVIAFSRITFY
jgi:heme A synthase